MRYSQRFSRRLRLWVLVGLLAGAGTKKGRVFVVDKVFTLGEWSLLHLPFRLRRAFFSLCFRLHPTVARWLLWLVTQPHGERLDWVKPVKQDGVNAVWIGPGYSSQSLAHIETAAPHLDLVIQYIHGGGFSVGHATMYMPSFMYLLEILKSKHGINAAILSIEYELSPKSRYPEAIHECMRGYCYLTHTLRIPGSKLLLAGESAGGNLVGTTLAVIGHQRDHAEYASLPKLPMPAGSVMISPWATLHAGSPSYAANEATDVIRTYLLNIYITNYLPRRVPMAHAEDNLAALARNPLVSILYADYKDVTPVLVVYSNAEVLQHEDAQLVKRLKHLGVQTDVIVRDHQPHVWIIEPMLATSLDAWKQDMNDMIDWMAARV
ncbi:Alpha/Beta hydrolase protein [Gongronella butleri]|nr:Alpha/Beta hydrolase protein [Gongronella butleri]